MLKITAADLVTAGFIACDQDLDITLAAANVQDSSAAQATITAANLLTEVTAATVDTAGSGYVIGDQVQVVAADLGGGSATNAVFTLVAADITDSNVFTLETISQGTIMNSSGTEGANGALTNGTRDNIRWEIQAPNTGSVSYTHLTLPTKRIV